MFKREHKGVRERAGMRRGREEKGRRGMRGGGGVETTTTDRTNIELAWEGKARPA